MVARGGRKAQQQKNQAQLKYNKLFGRKQGRSSW